MLALGIDTSTHAGSVGLVSEDGLLGELNLRSAAAHSARLLAAVGALLGTAGLDARRLDVIAVASGPGAFTGLRVGMATAKGLALAIGRPLVGFSTLETMALVCAEEAGQAVSRPVCILLDAGRGEVYRGLYRVGGGPPEALAPEAALRPSEAPTGVPAGVLVCGEGLAAYRSAIAPLLPPGAAVREEAPFIGAALARRALGLARSEGLDAPPPLAPNYLRLSDAERHLGG